MKKLMLIGMAAAAMLAGCSRNEVVEVNPENAISFENSFVNNMTKATDVTIDNLGAQTVYGVYKTAENAMVYAFQDQRVEKDGSYTPIQYWLKNAQYWFTAIAPFNNEEGMQANWKFTPATDETVAAGRGVLTFNNETAQAQEDLLMDVVDDFVCTSTKDMNKVALNYGHQLARLKFAFGNDFKTSTYQLRFSNIHITNAISEATMNVVDNASEWVAKGTERFDIPFAIGNDQIPVGTFIESEHMYLIPNADNNGAEYNITFTVERMQDGQRVTDPYIHTVPFSFKSMKKGHSYVLSVNFSEDNVNPTPDPENPEWENIEFTVSVEDWMDWNVDVD